jgi:hypothetical protein
MASSIIRKKQTSYNKGSNTITGDARLGFTENYNYKLTMFSSIKASSKECRCVSPDEAIIERNVLSLYLLC